MPRNRSNSRLRTIIVFIALFGLILASIFFSRRSAQQIRQSTTSIYNDRLIPTALLVELTETLYGKRLAVENYLLTAGKPDADSPASQLRTADGRIDSLMREFEQTKLTPEESQYLRAFQQSHQSYGQLEKRAVELAKTDLKKAQGLLFADTGPAVFAQATTQLHALTKLQVSVGDELLTESKEEISHVYVLTALQIGLLVLIAFAVFWRNW